MEVAVILNCPEEIGEVKEDAVIYADGGYKHKTGLKGKNTLAVIGDFDTLNKIPEDEKIIRLNKVKDFTDGERAVLYAKEVGAEKISIYGAFGGKPEHVLGNISLLRLAKAALIPAQIKYGGRIIVLVGKGEHRFCVKKGGSVSFIPQKKISFKKSDGLFYPLKGLTLTDENTRGISNEAISEEITFTVRKGEALLVYEY